MRYLSIRSGENYTVMGSIFHPLTPIYESRRVRDVKITFWLNAYNTVTSAAELRVAPGIAYSNDGVTWDYTVGGSNTTLGIAETYNKNLAAWISDQDRSLGNSALLRCPDATEGTQKGFQIPIETGTATALQYDLLYCRFGLFVTNMASSSDPHGGMAAMEVEFTDTDSGTITTPPTIITSNGGTSSPGNFTALSDWLDMTRVRYVRLSYVVEAAAGVTVELGYETSNTGVGIVGRTLITGRNQTGNGPNYGWSWVDLCDPTSSTPTVPDRFVRFGMYARNVSGTKDLGCRVALRVDWRGY